MYKNILVAYDGSDHAAKACEVAQEIAAKFGAALHLLHIVTHEHAPSAIEQFAKSEHVDNPDRIEVEAAGAQLLDPMVRAAQDAGVADVRTDVARGDPTEQILDYTRNSDVDMIVMGRRGVGRVEGLLVGSVSSKVSTLADCAVLTVK